MSNRKKIMFYETEDRQIKFRVRCQHDGLSQSEVLRILLTGYIEGDENIYEFVQNSKTRLNKQGKQKVQKMRHLKKLEIENINKFSLDEGEIENIFDMIETETNL